MRKSSTESTMSMKNISSNRTKSKSKGNPIPIPSNPVVRFESQAKLMPPARKEAGKIARMGTASMIHSKLSNKPKDINTSRGTIGISHPVRSLLKRQRDTASRDSLFMRKSTPPQFMVSDIPKTTPSSDISLLKKPRLSTQLQKRQNTPTRITPYESTSTATSKATSTATSTSTTSSRILSTLNNITKSTPATTSTSSPNNRPTTTQITSPSNKSSNTMTASPTKTDAKSKQQDAMDDIFAFLESEDKGQKRPSVENELSVVVKKKRIDSMQSKEKMAGRPMRAVRKKSDDGPVEVIDLDGDDVENEKYLLRYPFDKSKAVTVYQEDYNRLNNSRYLNDTIIDIFPKIWAERVKNKDTVYTFSSFFYTKLKTTITRSKLYNRDKAKADYEKVKRWTTDINIFEKKVLLIPVAEDNHWYLLLVNNPDGCIRSVHRESDIDKEPACIYVLDSMGSKHADACVNIKQYLRAAFHDRYSEKEFLYNTPHTKVAYCPQQSNFTDCGVYLLFFIHRCYYQYESMHVLLKKDKDNDPDWDPQNKLSTFRAYLKGLLDSVKKQYDAYMAHKT